jgi:abhydrolase domain-containing protein 6
LVHGFGANKDLWIPVAYFLSSKYRVVALDMPGFGESDKHKAANYGFGSQAARLGAFLDEIGIDEAHLVGHSMGGAIVGIYAAAHPKRVLSIAFLNAAGVKSPVESEYLELVRKGENPLLLRSYRDYVRLLPFVYAKPLWIPPRISRAIAARAIAATPFNKKVFDDIVAENKDLDEYALGAVLREIEARSLILWGGADRIMDPSSIPIMQRRLRSSRTVIIKDCGHLPLIESPRETAELLLEFLGEK